MMPVLCIAESSPCHPHSSHIHLVLRGNFQLTGLGAIWTLTDIIHMGEEDEEQKVPAALSKLDTYVVLAAIFPSDCHYRSIPI